MRFFGSSPSLYGCALPPGPQGRPLPYAGAKPIELSGCGHVPGQRDRTRLSTGAQSAGVRGAGWDDNDEVRIIIVGANAMKQERCSARSGQDVYDGHYGAWQAALGALQRGLVAAQRCRFGLYADVERTSSPLQAMMGKQIRVADLEFGTAIGGILRKVGCDALAHWSSARWRLVRRVCLGGLP